MTFNYVGNKVKIQDAVPRLLIEVTHTEKNSQAVIV